MERREVRPDWLSQVTQGLHRLARHIQTARSAEERVSIYIAGLSRLPKPLSRLEEVVLRGLAYEQTVGMGLVHACYAYGRASSSCWLCVLLTALTARSVPKGGHQAFNANSGRVDANRSASAVAGRAKALIDADYGSHLTLASLASKLGCHPRRLGRQYQQVFGITVGRYIVSVRIQKALELLAHSDLKVEAISRIVGLWGKANLYRQLRRAVGLTPGQVRGLRKTPRHPAAD